MITTTNPEQTHETCVPAWYGQHLERATVLSTAHIATVNAALETPPTASPRWCNFP